MRVVVGNLLKRIRTVFPVHEVLRLENRGTREVEHRRGAEIIGVAHEDNVGVREIGIDERIEEVAIARVGCVLLLVVRMRCIHVCPLLVPIETSHTACLVRIESVVFHVGLVGRNHLVVLEILVDVDVASGARKRHGNVAVVVEQCLVSLAPLGGGTRGPRAIVARHPVAMLVVVSRTFLLRTPIDLRNHDRMGFHHWHLLLELTDVVGGVVAVIAGAVPACVVVYGVAHVLVLDRAGCKVAVVRLPARARYPDDARETILANLVDDRLEEVVQSRHVVLSVGILQVHRLVTQFEGDLS